MMCKLLLLEIKDMLLDRKVISRVNTDMAYKYFLDLEIDLRTIKIKQKIGMLRSENGAELIQKYEIV